MSPRSLDTDGALLKVVEVVAALDSSEKSIWPSPLNVKDDV